MPGDVWVGNALTEASTLPDDEGQGASMKSCSEERSEAREFAKQEQMEQSDEMVASTDDVHYEAIPSMQDKDGPMTKMALQDVEVIGQDTISKEVLFEVATLSVEEKEEKEQKNRRDSVTVDKAVTQVEAAQVAEVEECADLIAQAKEVDNNGQGGEVVDRDEKERKQSQVCSLLWEER